MGELTRDPAPIGDSAQAWLNTTGRRDGCPVCTNTETPRAWAETASGYLLAYLCNDCGAAWIFETKEN